MTVETQLEVHIITPASSNIYNDLNDGLESISSLEQLAVILQESHSIVWTTNSLSIRQTTQLYSGMNDDTLSETNMGLIIAGVVVVVLIVVVVVVIRALRGSVVSNLRVTLDKDRFKINPTILQRGERKLGPQTRKRNGSFKRLVLQLPVNIEKKVKKNKKRKYRKRRGRRRTRKPLKTITPEQVITV